MAEHESPPTRGILSLMSRLSALAPVAGAAVTFGTLGAMHITAAVLIGVLATFIAFAGLLIASDWQADMQSRHDWAEIGLTPTHLSLTGDTGPASDIGHRYLATGSDEALQRVFRANHAAAQIARNAQLFAQSAEQPSSDPEWDQGGGAVARSEAHAIEGALRPVVGAPSRVTLAVARTWKGKRQKTEMAPRLRLVANGAPWSLWTTRIGPATQGSAEVVVMSAGQNDLAQSQPEASIDAGNAEFTRPVGLRSTTNNPDTPDPRRVGRRVVTDDLGPKIPITLEELDAIESYLETDLRKLFSSRKSGGLQEDV